MPVEQVRLAQTGDVLAMNGLIDALMPWLGRFCGSIALDAGPDAAQETLIQVMRDLKGLRDPGAFRGWVRRIALRESIRHAKRARKERFLPESALARERFDAGVPLDPSLARDVRFVLSQLSADQRAVLVLRDLEGLSEIEVANQLEIATGTVKSRLSRAREAFRKRWDE